MKWLCGLKGCGCCARIKEDKAMITLEFWGRHDKDSHKCLSVHAGSPTLKKKHLRPWFVPIRFVEQKLHVARRKTCKKSRKFHRKWWTAWRRMCVKLKENITPKSWNGNERNLLGFGSFCTKTHYCYGGQSAQWCPGSYWFAWGFCFELLKQFQGWFAFGVYNAP